MNRNQAEPTEFLNPLEKIPNGEEQRLKKQKTCNGNGEYVNGNSNNNASNDGEEENIPGFRERTQLGDKFIKEALPRLLEKALDGQTNKHG